MNGTRLSVRLDAKRAALLQRLCRELGCDTSETVRLALERLATPCGGGNADLVLQASAERSELPPVPQMIPNPDASIAVARPVSAMARAVEGCPTLPSMPATPGPPYPHKLFPLPDFRAFGAKLPGERRRLFHHLYAAAKVICESSDNPQDTELRNELMRIGREYNQL